MGDEFATWHHGGVGRWKFAAAVQLASSPSGSGCNQYPTEGWGRGPSREQAPIGPRFRVHRRRAGRNRRQSGGVSHLTAGENGACADPAGGRSRPPAGAVDWRWQCLSHAGDRTSGWTHTPAHRPARGHLPLSFHAGRYIRLSPALLAPTVRQQSRDHYADGNFLHNVNAWDVSRNCDEDVRDLGKAMLPALMR